MSSEATRRVPPSASQPQDASNDSWPQAASTALRSPTKMMSLAELVERYRSLAGEFGKPVALSAFQLSAAETERLFSGYDEDYHISRFFHFSHSGGMRFSISGEPVTHVSLDAEIQTIL